MRARSGGASRPIASLLTALATALALPGLQGCISDYSEKYLLRRNPPFEPAVKTVEPRLESSVFTCWNGIDDDLDGNVDCADDDCKAIMVKCNPPDTIRNIPIPLVETGLDRCSNRIDDDLDGRIDCKDTGCQGLKFCDTTFIPPLPQNFEDTPQECSDRADNDLDGNPDCDDSACKHLLICRADTTKPNDEDDFNECQDQKDNDKDGLADCEDPGCAAAWTFCPPKVGTFPEINWFVNTREVHTLPGTVEMEYFVSPKLALDSGWSFYESDLKVNTGGTNGPVPGCRDADMQAYGVEVMRSGDAEARAPDRYSGQTCAADASITYLRYGELLSYALVVEKPVARFRVKARAASGKFGEDPMRNPPYIFSANFYNPRSKLLPKASLTYHMPNTGGWHTWGTFLPQKWVKGTAYTGDCTKPMTTVAALKASDCWVKDLPEDTLVLTKGQWIMELVSQEGSYDVNYFEFEELP